MTEVLVDNYQFGNRLRECREALGMAQKDLAAESGVNKSTISRLESGASAMATGGIVASLAQALNVSADYLLGLANSPRVIRDERTYGLTLEDVLTPDDGSPEPGPSPDCDTWVGGPDMDTIMQAMSDSRARRWFCVAVSDDPIDTELEVIRMIRQVVDGMSDHVTPESLGRVRDWMNDYMWHRSQRENSLKEGALAPDGDF